MNRLDNWCGTGLLRISKAYKPVHGYVGIAICLIGAVGNVLNIKIFGQRKNIGSPVNIILRCLSIVDLIVLIIYVPFSWITIVRKSTDVQTYSYERSVILWYYNYVTQTLHTIDIWLTVTLALWRYFAIAHPLRKKFWCSVTFTKRVILSGFVVCSLLCAPLLYTFRIQTHDLIINQYGFIAEEGNRTRLYSLGVKEPADVITDFNFIIYSVLLRLVPSILLSLLSVKLICRLTKSVKIREQLTSAATGSEKQMDRISIMILAVLFLFLVNEIPQSVLILLAVFYGEQVFHQCYNPMGEILDTLGLLNSSLHFFLYYAISRHFRNTLYRVTGLCRSSKKRKISFHSDVVNDGLSLSTRAF